MNVADWLGILKRMPLYSSPSPTTLANEKWCFRKRMMGKWRWARIQCLFPQSISSSSTLNIRWSATQLQSLCSHTHLAMRFFFLSLHSNGCRINHFQFEYAHHTCAFLIGISSGWVCFMYYVLSILCIGLFLYRIDSLWHIDNTSALFRFIHYRNCSFIFCFNVNKKILWNVIATIIKSQFQWCLKYPGKLLLQSKRSNWCECVRVYVWNRCIELFSFGAHINVIVNFASLPHTWINH